MPNNGTVRLSSGERRAILDRLYDRFVSLGDAYNDRGATRLDKRRLRTERRYLARLINKLEGRIEINVQTDL